MRWLKAKPRWFKILLMAFVVCGIATLAWAQVANVGTKWVSGNFRFFDGATSILTIKSSTSGVQVHQPLDIDATVDIDGTSVTIDGGLTNIGGATFDTADGDNDLGVTAVLEVDGATDLDGTLAVAGAATLATTLAVTGNSTLTGTLTVNNNQTTTGTLGVTGATTLSSTLGVTGVTTLTGGRTHTKTATSLTSPTTAIALTTSWIELNSDANQTGHTFTGGVVGQTYMITMGAGSNTARFDDDGLNMALGGNITLTEGQADALVVLCYATDDYLCLSDRSGN